MKKLVLALIFAAAIALVGPASRAECAGQPSYLILRAPARIHKGNAYFPGRGYEVRTQAYAYGWFGARPRDSWRRTTGYNSSYIQWSKR